MREKCFEDALQPAQVKGQRKEINGKLKTDLNSIMIVQYLFSRLAKQPKTIAKIIEILPYLLKMAISPSYS